MNIRFKNIFDQRGAAAIIVVVIIGAATFLIAVTASYLGLAQLETGFTSSKKLETTAAADGCLDEMLYRLSRDPNYGLLISPINLSIGNGSCIINVVDLGSSRRRITAAATVGDFHKKIQAAVDLAGEVLVIDSWQEISN